jgi:hypothetical protein
VCGGERPREDRFRLLGALPHKLKNLFF